MKSPRTMLITFLCPGILMAATPMKLNVARKNHFVQQLKNGSILISGGDDDSSLPDDQGLETEMISVVNGKCVQTEIPARIKTNHPVGALTENGDVIIASNILRNDYRFKVSSSQYELFSHSDRHGSTTNLISYQGILYASNDESPFVWRYVQKHQRWVIQTNAIER